VEVDLRRLDVAGKPRFIATSRDITERKGVEQELRNTKRLLETTFESLAEAVLVVDPAEREIIACNAAVEDVLGYEKEELIGKCTEKLHTSPAAYEHFGDISEPVLEEEGVFQHQYQMQRKEGTIIDTEHVVTPLQNERWPEGVVSIIRDITERKEAVEQLREERDLLSRIFETSPAAITVLNTEGEFMEVSDRAKDVLGLEKSEVTERTYDDPAWDIRGPEGGPIPDEDLPFARVTATGEPVYDIEHRIAWPDGTHRLLSVSGAPLHTPDGELEGAVFHIDDITERRAAKDALQEERDRFATLFRNLSTPVVHGRPDADGSLRVESVNERFETVFGYKESDIRGDDLQGLIVPDEETDTAESMRRRLLSGAPVNREVRRRAADGLRDFRVQVALRDGDRPTEGFAIYTDVTDRKERERMLARRKALLEAQAEAIIDGLLVVDTDRTVSFFNDRFLKIWDVSVENFKRARPDVSTGKLLEVMENLLSDPDSFREKVEYLHDHPDKKDRDVIRLTDGRWLDQYSAPIVNNDNHFGRLWIFRDVTDQRRMLERLLEVQEEERRRIDQEIHDEMGGLLTSLQFTVDLARRTTQDADAQGEPLDQLEELISELATVSRTISRKLYPSALAERGLAEALSDLINELKTEHDLHVDFYSEIEPGDRFSAPIERTVYWIVQEILMGIVRRDDVDEAQAIANRRDEQLYLHFFDERVAFPSSTQDGTGDFRFQAIQRRVEWLDGTVRIDTIPDEGTRLSVILPVRHRFPGR
jgi:PAS domain S-box-containing protein